MDIPTLVLGFIIGAVAILLYYRIYPYLVYRKEQSNDNQTLTDEQIIKIWNEVKDKVVQSSIIELENNGTITFIDLTKVSCMFLQDGKLQIHLNSSILIIHDNIETLYRLMLTWQRYVNLRYKEEKNEFE